MPCLDLPGLPPRVRDIHSRCLLHITVDGLDALSADRYLLRWPRRVPIERLVDDALLAIITATSRGPSLALTSVSPLSDSNTASHFFHSRIWNLFVPQSLERTLPIFSRKSQIQPPVGYREGLWPLFDHSTSPLVAVTATEGRGPGSGGLSLDLTEDLGG